jgi:SAM-dependent methyltransferase
MSEDVDLEIRSQAFGAWVAEYHEHRPRYPQEAIDTILSERPANLSETAANSKPPRILELGAGTGILSEELVGAGAEVIALEPDERMHEVLARTIGSDKCVIGSAEQIPLPDDSVDIVVGAQMWHWVDPAQAVPEIARVLRPGGTLAILWALRDDQVDWVADLNRLVGLADTYRAFTDGDFPSLGPCFSPAQPVTIHYNEPTNADRLVAQFRTHSALVLRGDIDETEAKTRELVSEHPDLSDHEDFDQPYVCKLFRSERLTSDGPCDPH